MTRHLARLAPTTYDRLALPLLLLLSALVMLTFRDYGISNDEEVQNVYGRLLLSFYTSGFTDWSAFHYKNLFLYGGLFDLVAKHCGPGEGLLAGNTIHHDRRFLSRYMPLVERYLSYRQVDVSSLKLLTRAWFPDSPSFQKPESNHRALADIRGSIAELRHYRETYFRANPA